MGLALQGKLADFTEFDRKNYFYPDIPKGYQISQYKYPLVQGGVLNNVAITRVHLEEDTARSLHEEGDYSLIDYNRAGVPLMELVTEPVIKSAKEAARFAKELQLLLRTLRAGEANMEKGEMRVEANISVSKGEVFGTKVEIKNLNSFRAVERAIEYEIKRQSTLLDRGEKVVQETRGWSEEKGETFSQRLKEDSHDYRYFPDPDLPKLHLSEIGEFSPDVLWKEMPELPDQKRERFSRLGLKAEDVEALLSDEHLTLFFDEVIKHLKEEQEALLLAANYLMSDVVGITVREGKALSHTLLTPHSFSNLMRMVLTEELSSRGAKDVLAVLVREGGEAKSVAEKHGLLQKHDEGELRQIVKAVIKQNESIVNEYKSGKIAALKFLVGQGMKESRGSANPKVLEKLFVEELHETS